MDSIIQHRVANRRNRDAPGDIARRQMRKRPQREVSARRAAAYPYLVVRKREPLLEFFGKHKPRSLHAVVTAGRPAIFRRCKAIFDVERREAKPLREEACNAFPARAVAARPSAAVDGQDDWRFRCHLLRQIQIAQSKLAVLRRIRNIADNPHFSGRLRTAHPTIFGTRR